MRFTFPLALLLLLLLPAIAALGWPGRGYGRTREGTSLALRLLIVLSLALALAGLEIVRPTRELAVVFLLDASDSMPPASKAAALEWVQNALQTMGPDDRAALVVFGADALVERPMSAGAVVGKIASLPETHATDLAEALDLGLALFPPGAARRLVVLSDGAANSGDAESASRLAAASGVQVLAVPFLSQSGPEVRVEAVEAPSRLSQGERFSLRMVLEATQPTRATVRVLSAGRIVFAELLDLQRGRQAFDLPLTAGEPGFSAFQVLVEPEIDTYAQNNALSTYAQVEGPPRVLVVAPPPGQALPLSGENRPDEAAALLHALQAAGLETRRALPAELPTDLPALAGWDGLVLVDVPARDLSSRQMLAMQSYVRDLGGGLLAVGGPTSFGVGGYFRTPLEEILPVEMQIKDEQRRPSLGMVFIIDRSGSMTEISGGAIKLELAKEAALRSVEMLFPSDRVGVIAFDDSATWVVPMTSLSDPLEVEAAIGSIRSGGGTDILAGLQALERVFPDDPAGLKHAILLTDGGADPTGLPELAQALFEQHGITLSTIGIGSDAAPFLPQLAELGGGRYHFAADPASIPRIFTEETSLATRAYLIERSFTPAQVAPSPILYGLEGLPPLYGYVGTTAKSTARTVLVSDLGDPVLATWQYGLGKAAAFTSDASGRWARDWLGWTGFPAFWAQNVAYVQRQRSESPLEVQVEPPDDGEETAQLVVEGQTPAGGYLNGYELHARVVEPGGGVQELTLQQTAPGRYEAEFTPAEQGAYLVGVAGTAEGSEAVSASAGWVQSYSPEYRQAGAQPERLERLAVLGGGRILGGADTAAAFRHHLPAGLAVRPAWPWLLALAALLLPFDVAARRLVISPAELRRGLVALTGRLRHPPTTEPTPSRSERIKALMQAKERTYTTSETPPAEIASPLPSAARIKPTPHSQDRSETPPPEVSSAEPETDDTAPASPTSTAASLLASKRDREKGKK